MTTDTTTTVMVKNHNAVDAEGGQGVFKYRTGVTEQNLLESLSGDATSGTGYFPLADAPGVTVVEGRNAFMDAVKIPSAALETDLKQDLSVNVGRRELTACVWVIFDLPQQHPSPYAERARTHHRPAAHFNPALGLGLA